MIVANIHYISDTKKTSYCEILSYCNLYIICLDCFLLMQKSNKVSYIQYVCVMYLCVYINKLGTYVGTVHMMTYQEFHHVLHSDPGQSLRPESKHIIGSEPAAARFK